MLAQTDTELIDSGLTQEDWIRAAALLFGAVLLAILINRILRSVLMRVFGPGFAAIIVARLVAYVAFFSGLFYVLTELGVRVGPLLGALGLGGLVLALALQSFVENLVSGIVLQSRRPFKVGDTVRLGQYLGNVVDVDSRTVVLQALDGTWIRIPNSNVASDAIENLTRSPSRRSSVLVGVAYDSDLYAATRVLNEALTRVPRVLKDPPSSVVLNEFGESSIVFNVFYWHASDVPAELAARHDVILAVHHALASAEITIAFPQVVVWSGDVTDSGPLDCPVSVSCCRCRSTARVCSSIWPDSSASHK